MSELNWKNEKPNLTLRFHLSNLGRFCGGIFIMFCLFVLIDMLINHNKVPPLSICVAFVLFTVAAIIVFFFSYNFSDEGLFLVLGSCKTKVGLNWHGADNFKIREICAGDFLGHGLGVEISTADHKKGMTLTPFQIANFRGYCNTILYFGRKYKCVFLNNSEWMLEQYIKYGYFWRLRLFLEKKSASRNRLRHKK